MSKITCIRLLHETVKAENLLASISAIAEGASSPAIFEADSLAFNDVPNAPFAYWIGNDVRSVFKLMRPFEDDNRTARVGLQTGDNFRFVRCWWEVSVNLDNTLRRWYTYAKGGAYSPYYSDLYLAVNWHEKGKEIKCYAGSVVRNEPYYLTEGLTWSEATTSEFGARILPQGCLFDSVGPSVFSTPTGDLVGLCVLINSPQLRALMGLSLGLADAGRRHYTVGTVQRLPIANASQEFKTALNDIGHAAWRLQRCRDFTNEISHFFVSPLVEFNALDSLEVIKRNIDEEQERRHNGISILEQRASELIAEVYGFTPPTPNQPLDAAQADVEERRVSQPLECALFSYLVGLAFGRWKIVQDPAAAKQAYGDDPFAPLPPYAAAFNAAPGTNEQAVFLEGDYLLQSIREKLIACFGEAKAATIEGQLCAMLSVDSLDEYLHRPAGFFADHVSQYSESRRQAPIYWPISTKSGSLTIWLYYPRLNKDTLARLITEVLDPKLRRSNEELAALSGQGKVGLRKAELELFAQELSEMKGEFQRLIEAGYLPNLDDGVLITASPLAKFFRYPKFRKDLEGCWKELARGDYDWAHLAMAMWPQRVLKACQADRSIAIAHRREDLCPPEAPRPTRGRRPSA